MTWSIPPQPYIFLKLKPRKMMGKIEFRPESDRTTRTRVTDYFVEYISEIRYAPTCAARDTSLLECKSIVNTHFVRSRQMCPYNTLYTIDDLYQSQR